MAIVEVMPASCGPLTSTLSRQPTSRHAGISRTEAIVPHSVQLARYRVVFERRAAASGDCSSAARRSADRSEVSLGSIALTSPGSLAYAKGTARTIATTPDVASRQTTAPALQVHARAGRLKRERIWIPFEVPRWGAARTPGPADIESDATRRRIGMREDEVRGCAGRCMASVRLRTLHAPDVLFDGDFVLDDFPGRTRFLLGLAVFVQRGKHQIRVHRLL